MFGFSFIVIAFIVVIALFTIIANITVKINGNKNDKYDDDEEEDDEFWNECAVDDFGNANIYGDVNISNALDDWDEDDD
jgi:hypothetical protein